MATQVTDKTATYTNKILYTGTQAAIEAGTRQEYGLYFANDTYKIYKGTADYTQAARVVSAMPNGTTEPIAKNAFYVVKDNSGKIIKAIATDGSGNQIEVAYALSTTIPSGSASASDEKVATEAAVKAYVDAQIGSGAIHSVEAATGTYTVDTETGAVTMTNAASITVDSGLSSENTFAVPGVALIPTWDSTSRVLKIPYTGIGTKAAGTLTVDIGTDLVVNHGSYDPTSEKILLWITPHDYQTDPADIEIPVADLIDEIDVADTDTVNMTYTTSTNTISADVIISAMSGNALQVLTSQATAANNGLYVDLSSYALASDLADVVTDIGTLDDNMDVLYAALTTWTTVTTTAAGE